MQNYILHSGAQGGKKIKVVNLLNYKTVGKDFWN